MDHQEPVYLNQLDELGEKEKIDVTINSIKVICNVPGCIQIRYVRGQDKYQVKFCKPHARLSRLALRAKRARNKRAKISMRSV